MDKRPDIAYIRKYVNGELSPREMFEIEKATHEDEGLMDIVLGLEAEKEQGADPEAVQVLQQEIARRTGREQRMVKSIPWRLIGIAASFLLVLGIGTMLWLRQDAPESPWVASQPVLKLEKDKQVVPQLTPEPEEEIVKPSVAPRRGGRGRRVETEDVVHVPDIIELELPQPRHDREESIPFGLSASQRDSVQVMASAAARPDMLDIVPFSENMEEGKMSGMMVRGRAAAPLKNREGSSNITNIPVENIKSITTGIVVDQQTQQPVIGAVIKDLKTRNMVRTDSTGRFVIASTEEKTDIQVDYLGFESTTLAANGSMRIELYPAESTLEEVVMKRDSVVKKVKTKPAMGEQAYRKYIDNTAKNTHLGKGTVVLVFNIDSNGRPVNIRVKRSVGAEHDQQAIRIIQKGPSWISGDGNDNVEWKVNF